jgi:NodT family efflux transporter outer membrane factor (OMF) lipoprotein
VQEQARDLASARFQAGLAPELDVTRAEAQLATTKAAIPGLETAFRQAAHRLSVLVGTAPGTLVGELSQARAVPAIPPEVAVGIPAELARRRPDIRRAERELAAASARVGVATADLLPRFTLLGSFGFESTQIGTLFSGDSRLWSIGPAMRWPIIEAGRIRNNIKVQDARQEQALIAYEQTVLTALEEVENALTAYAREQVRFQSLSDAVQQERRSVELAEAQYVPRLVDFLTVLDAQRQMYELEDQQAQSRAAMAVNLVSLYKALGGGWERELPMQTANGK